MSTEAIPASDLLKINAKLEEVEAALAFLSQRRQDLLTALGDFADSTSGLKALAESRKWTPSTYGEYIFATEKGSNAPIAELKPLLEAIARLPSLKLVLGNYEYFRSNPKFLNRRAA